MVFLTVPDNCEELLLEILDKKGLDNFYCRVYCRLGWQRFLGIIKSADECYLYAIVDR